MVPARALPVLLHVLLAAVASGSPDDGLAEVEPDLRVVTRRGPSGFGVVARLTSSGFGEVNLITGLRGTAAEDELLRVGDLVLELDESFGGGRGRAGAGRPGEKLRRLEL